jgi:hypothetical protein
LTQKTQTIHGSLQYFLSIAYVLSSLKNQANGSHPTACVAGEAFSRPWLMKLNLEAS